MIFEYENHKLEIKQNVLDVFNRFRQTEPVSNESGGILIGRYIESSFHVVIDMCTTPQLGDKQSRFFFSRSKKYHQEILNEIWGYTNATKNYLGEWHTHPEKTPLPSEHDLNQWVKLLKNQNNDIENIFFVIVGIENIRVWKGNLIERNIVEMKGL
ncbi:Mov34/MPN/PAD-1 family protein [Psychrobacillus sp. FSL K6-2684]|uniref:Mov34/MPN/PAD-1 family protein n=1 Tax=Psychrobacillus sp. FSL K6-2684 TaxID=2921547 RepID=UPI0030FA3537